MIIKSPEVKNVDKSDYFIEKNSFENLEKKIKDQLLIKDNEFLFNFILDHTTIVHGIGIIKRWFNEDYVKQNLKNKKKKIFLNLHISYFTLRELKFIKRGNTITARNAREAFRFIEKIIERQKNQTLNKENQQLIYNIEIDSQKKINLSWNKCLEYNIFQSDPQDCINQHSFFDSESYKSSVFSQNSLDDRIDDFQDKNSALNQTKITSAFEKGSEIPVKYRHLIKFCVHKKFIEKINFKNQHEEWKLITEDVSTKFWMKKFGINTFNINEAELLIFENYDINLFNFYNPHSNFCIDDEDKICYELSKKPLHNIIDTTIYKYKNMNFNELKKKKKSSKKKTNEITNEITNEVTNVIKRNCIGVNGNIVNIEKFDVINFAPRGKGTLYEI